jgi:RNA polymerase sigma factor (sigma-70 family)
VRACYAEGRTVRRWSPSLRLLPEDAPDGSNALAEVIDRDRLETAIRRLSVDHRTVLVLHHYADLPLDRVAQILEIPIGTVYSRLHYAMRAMRVALAADDRPARSEAVR